MLCVPIAVFPFLFFHYMHFFSMYQKFYLLFVGEYPLSWGIFSTLFIFLWYCLYWQLHGIHLVLENRECLLQSMLILIWLGIQSLTGFFAWRQKSWRVCDSPWRLVWVCFMPTLLCWNSHICWNFGCQRGIRHYTLASFYVCGSKSFPCSSRNTEVVLSQVW